MDLFQMEFILPIAERKEALTILDSLNKKQAYCSACSSPVQTAWLRKHHDTPLHESMCLPCFLHNFTDIDQENIDRMVELGQRRGMYND